MSVPQTFFRDESDTIFSSPNSQDPPPLAQTDPCNTENGVRLRHTRSIQWASNKYPYLGFAPVGDPFVPPLFDRLQFDFHGIPLDYDADKNSWSLNIQHCMRWARLESALCATIQTMLKKLE